MEFGIFLNGFTPGSAAPDRASEHLSLISELDVVINTEPMQDSWPTSQARGNLRSR